jgi:hypothetical protein
MRRCLRSRAGLHQCRLRDPHHDHPRPATHHAAPHDFATGNDVHDGCAIDNHNGAGHNHSGANHDNVCANDHVSANHDDTGSNHNEHRGTGDNDDSGSGHDDHDTCTDNNDHPGMRRRRRLRRRPLSPMSGRHLRVAA